MTLVALLGLGIALLLTGGAALVRGASAIATQFGISPLIIGLTVVAFGTSAPELVVTVVGAIRGETALVFGNVVGSNIANLGLVLGLAAVVMPLAMPGNLVKRELPLLLVATSVLLVMCADLVLGGLSSQLDRADATVLLILFAGFLYITGREGYVERKRSMPENSGAAAVAASLNSGRRHWVYALAGTLGLALGGHLTVVYGAQLALSLGIEPVVIGLLLVAVGTSLPELACSIIAAVKHEADLCIGNVLGSNLFNGLLVLPVGALIQPTPTPAGGTTDLLIALLFTIMLIPIFIMGRARLGRRAGTLLLITYMLYATLRLHLA